MVSVVMCELCLRKKSYNLYSWDFKYCYGKLSVKEFRLTIDLPIEISSTIWYSFYETTLECGINVPARLLIFKLFFLGGMLLFHTVFFSILSFLTKTT